MIQILDRSSGNALGVQADDKLTAKDYEEVWIPHLEEIINRGEKIRCLLYLSPAFKGWEMGALWDDAKFGLAHRNDFTKLAIVGAPGWVEWSTKLMSHFTSAETHFFPEGSLDEAWDWLES